MFLYQVTTAKEIEQEYGLPEGSVRRDISRGKFRKSEVRKSGSTWLISWREAKRVYKDELTFIPVVNDWEWIRQHVEEELKNETLFDLALDFLEEPFLDLNDLVHRLGDLYRDGLVEGMEDGKYLPFSQWFYEYSEQHGGWME